LVVYHSPSPLEDFQFQFPFPFLQDLLIAIKDLLIAIKDLLIRDLLIPTKDLLKDQIIPKDHLLIIPTKDLLEMDHKDRLLIIPTKDLLEMDHLDLHAMDHLDPLATGHPDLPGMLPMPALTATANLLTFQALDSLANASISASRLADNHGTARSVANEENHIWKSEFDNQWVTAFVVRGCAACIAPYYITWIQLQINELLSTAAYQRKT